MEKSEFSYRQILTSGAYKAFMSQSWFIFNSLRRNNFDAERACDVLQTRAENAKRAIDEFVAWIEEQIFGDDYEDDYEDGNAA